MGISYEVYFPSWNPFTRTTASWLIELCKPLVTFKGYICKNYVLYLDNYD